MKNENIVIKEWIKIWKKRKVRGREDDEELGGGREGKLRWQC